jgi:hypothetical protein
MTGLIGGAFLPVALFTYQSNSIPFILADICLTVTSADSYRKMNSK